MLTANNFSEEIKGEPHGVGFMHQEAIPLRSIVHSADTTPTADASGLRFTLNAAAETLVFDYAIPESYSDLADELVVRLLVLPTNTVDRLELDSATYVRPGATAAASITVTGINDTPTTALTLEWLELRLSKKGLRGGDSVTFTVGGNHAATDAIYVYGVQVGYRRHTTIKRADLR